MTDREYAAVHMAAELVKAYVSNNSARPDEVKQLLADTIGLLRDAAPSLPSESAPPIPSQHGKTEPKNSDVEKTPLPTKPTPTEISASVTPGYIISFENGKRYKTLRKHLNLHGLTPLTYREKWGLPDDYPMTAAEYSQARAAITENTSRNNPGWRGRRPARKK